jgi:glycosyltransferase involved in cell wall biosynthesis
MKKLSQPRITIVVPCYGRPLRTRRTIENILAQTINNWEAFIIGDGCSDFQKIIDSGDAKKYQTIAKETGNILHIYNLKKHHGGYGAYIINKALDFAKGKYLIFCGNDDIILLNHFEHYLSEIEGTDFDMVYFNTIINPSNVIRNTELKEGYIGHSEIIVKTDFVRRFKHDYYYGHDWRFIQRIINYRGKIKKANSEDYTYIVMHVPGLPEEGIN